MVIGTYHELLFLVQKYSFDTAYIVHYLLVDVILFIHINLLLSKYFKWLKCYLCIFMIWNGHNVFMTLSQCNAYIFWQKYMSKLLPASIPAGLLLYILIYMVIFLSLEEYFFHKQCGDGHPSVSLPIIFSVSLSLIKTLTQQYQEVHQDTSWDWVHNQVKCRECISNTNKNSLILSILKIIFWTNVLCIYNSTFLFFK